MSGFAALPRQLINAARVMGASPWRTFWRVELPLLKPAIVIAVIIRSMEALKLFEFDSIVLLLIFLLLIYFGIYMLISPRRAFAGAGRAP